MLMEAASKVKGTLHQCKICCAPASFTNFGVLSCSSCKMFFKRNAECKKEPFECNRDKRCNIDVNSRRTCSACRLAKCFASGMQIGLIRSARTHKNTRRTKKCVPSSSTGHGNEQFQQLPVINLLRGDHSTLTDDQWTLLSNLMSCYEEHSGLPTAQRFVEEQNSLPLKLRYKVDVTGEFLVNISIQARRVFEQNTHYRALCAQDRSTLFRCIIAHAGGIAGTFILHQLRPLHDPFFYQTCEGIIGSDTTKNVLRLAETFDKDTVFVRLILTTLAFSTIRHTVYDENAPRDLLDVKSVLQIQDTYAELAWRYMTYQYDYEHVVIRFSHLVRYLLRVTHAIAQIDTTGKHNKTIGRALKQTEQMSIDNP